MRKIILLILLYTLFLSSAIAGTIGTNSGLDITLPYALDFNGTDWAATNHLTLDECGGTGSRVTSGCYEGAACLKTIPPTSLCTGDNTNGGAVGIGVFRYSNTSRIHVRFLIYFGSTFYENIAGISLVNKFLLQDYPARTGILGFNADGATNYAAFGVQNSGTGYSYRTPPNRGWIQDAEFKVSATEHHSEWICVEYWIDVSVHKTGLYIWTRDGSSWTIDDVDSLAGSSQTGFYISYYNCYGISDPNNFYLMDELAVSSSYIGPPSGFIQGEDTTAPTLQSATIGASGTAITLAFDEAVSIGAGGNGGVSLSMSGGAVTATYSSGSGSNSLVYSLSRTVYSGETGTAAYTQPGNGIEDAAGNDLATFSGESVANDGPEEQTAANMTPVRQTGGVGVVRVSGGLVLQ